MGSARFARVKRHTIPVMLFTAILIGITTFFIISSVFTKMEKRFSERMKAALYFQATAAGDILEEHILRENDEIENLAEKIALTGWDEKTVSLILADHVNREMKQGELLAGGILTDMSGNILGAFPADLPDEVPSTFRKRLSRISSRGKNNPGIGFVELGQGEIVLALSRAIRNPLRESSREKGPEGYVTLFYIFKQIQRSYMGSFPSYVVANNMGRLFFSGWDLDWRQKEFQLSGSDVPRDIREVGWELMSGRSGRGFFRHNDASYLLAYTPVVISSGEEFINTSPSPTGADFLISVGVFQDESVFLRDVRLTQSGFFLFAAAFLIILLTLGGAILLTYRHRAAEEVRLYNAQLETVRETAGGAAHRIFQPLTAIYGNLALIRMILKKNPPDMEEQVLKKLNDIQNESGIITDMVEKMKEIMEYRTEKYLGKKRITVFTRKKDV